jgi:monoamine oxidase
VLEAQNRIGGRIHTVRSKSDCIELGAQWIHGQKNNPVYELCKKLNFVDEQTKSKWTSTLS